MKSWEGVARGDGTNGQRQRITCMTSSRIGVKLEIKCQLNFGSGYSCRCGSDALLEINLRACSYEPPPEK